jgi:Type IV secretion-system coupling protein DNA-binding domain
MPDVIWRLFSVTWGGVPISYVVVLAVGGLMYAAMSMSTRSATSSSPIALRRPGWIARRRARSGIAHRRDRVGVGYKSAVGTVHLTLRELAGHGAAFGGPGSGKTTFLQLLVEASAGQQPVVIVDPKGSPALVETVRAHGGQIWTHASETGCPQHRDRCRQYRQTARPSWSRRWARTSWPRSSDAGRRDTTNSGRVSCGRTASRPYRQRRACTDGSTTRPSSAVTWPTWWCGGACTGQSRGT